ncbi:MAG TPA: DUF4386 domain-containing protein [Flavisolibacter sp.]|nr:DUF4386 domain-containing protein [Flavisolibacter sp.]
MKENIKYTSTRTAALIGGFSLLVMVIAAPFVELIAYPKLVIPGKATETIQNIKDNRGLFTYVIFGYLLTFISDVVVAWALYILLKPVNEHLSLLTAIFRWIYTVIALVALLNLVTVYRIVNTSDYLNVFQPGQLNAEIMLLLKTFKSSWYFGLIFFSIHLVLLGYLVMRSGYIPFILGIVLIITGFGYLLTNLRPYLFPTINIDFAKYTFYGELIFMLWLLIKGWRIKEMN